MTPIQNGRKSMPTIEAQIAAANQRKLEEFDTALKTFLEQQLEDVEKNGKLFTIVPPAVQSMPTLLSRLLAAFGFGRTVVHEAYAGARQVALFEIKGTPYFWRFRMYTTADRQLFIRYDPHSLEGSRYGVSPIRIYAERLLETEMLPVVQSALQSR